MMASKNRSYLAGALPGGGAFSLVACGHSAIERTTLAGTSFDGSVSSSLLLSFSSKGEETWRIFLRQGIQPSYGAKQGPHQDCNPSWRRMELDRCEDLGRAVALPGSPLLNAERGITAFRRPPRGLQRGRERSSCELSMRGTLHFETPPEAGSPTFCHAQVKTQVARRRGWWCLSSPGMSRGSIRRSVGLRTRTQD